MSKYRIIPCAVTAEYVRGSGIAVGAAGSHHDVILELEFSEMWKGLAKSITWLDANGENPTFTILTAVMLKNGTSSTYLVPIPAEPKRFAGEMTMTIKGVEVTESFETRATLTTSCRYIVLPSDFDEHAMRECDINSTLAEQLQIQIDQIIDEIASVNAAAEEAKASAAAAEAAKNAIDTLEVSAFTLGSESEATVKKETKNGVEHFTFGIPRGKTGNPGAGIIDVNSGTEIKVWYGTVSEYNALDYIDPSVDYRILEGVVS